MHIDKCPFCGEKYEHMQGFSAPDYIEIVCQTCGAVAITPKALGRIHNNQKEKEQIRHLLIEKNIKDRLELSIAPEVTAEGEIKDILLTKKILLIADKGDNNVLIPCQQYSLDEYLAAYPKTVTDKLNRSLANLARLHSLPNTVGTVGNYKTEYYWTNSISEAQYFTDMLVNSGLCTRHSIHKKNHNFFKFLLLTLEGWKKFEELEKNWKNSTTAFIAMWFNDVTEKYRDAVKEAIRQAGYEPKVIDDHEHNNFIMDEVINQINEAKFVIADFTCIPEQPENNSKIPGGVRGGVYFEAGYAKGLGKEVIVTCKDDADSQKRRHFDIDQLNTLFWDEKDGKLYDRNGKDFVHRLAERIKATVGKGKLYTEKI